jgi:ribonuclease H2 subunit C
MDSVPESADGEGREGELQFVPCSVESNIGEVNVAAYFSPFTRNSDSCIDTMEAALRGRPLLGHVVKLPKKYECVVLQSVRGGHEKKQWRATKRLDRFTYWNYDRQPSDEDKLKKALQWIKLAKIMHEEQEK